MNQIILTPSQTLVLSDGASGVSVTVHFADWLPSGQLAPGNQLTAIASASETVVCAAPVDSNARRLIKSLSITNASGASVTFTLGIKSGSVYAVRVATLADDATYSF